MSDTITYNYDSASTPAKSGNQDELFIAKYREVEKKGVFCFFRQAECCVIRYV